MGSISLTRTNPGRVLAYGLGVPHELQLLCGDVVDVEARAVVCAELELVGRPSVEVLRKEALKILAIVPCTRTLQVRLSALLDSPEECDDSPEPKLLVGTERLSCPEHWHRPVVSFEAIN
jgi:hypothetical protein